MNWQPAKRLMVAAFILAPVLLVANPNAYAQAYCGDGIIQWRRGEQCEPFPGLDRCGGGRECVDCVCVSVLDCVPGGRTDPAFACGGRWNPSDCCSGRCGAYRSWAWWWNVFCIDEAADLGEGACSFAGGWYVFNGWSFFDSVCCDGIMYYGQTNCDAVGGGGPPDDTAIELSFFGGTPKAGKVILEWATESELDSLGFNVLRSESEDGDYEQINGSLIPTVGSTREGASYEFVDEDARNRKTYWYKLQEIDIYGTSTMYGPVEATPRLIHGR